MTIDAAAAQYLEIVTPSNCALQQLVEAVDALDSDFTFEEWDQQARPLAQEKAAADITFYEALTEASWPEEVQPIVDRLVAEVADEAGRTKRVADAEDLPTIEAALSADAVQGNAAAELRAKLKLPSNITDDSDACA